MNSHGCPYSLSGAGLPGLGLIDVQCHAWMHTASARCSKEGEALMAVLAGWMCLGDGADAVHPDYAETGELAQCFLPSCILVPN